MKIINNNGIYIAIIIIMIQSKIQTIVIIIIIKGNNYIDNNSIDINNNCNDKDKYIKDNNKDNSNNSKYNNNKDKDKDNEYINDIKQLDNFAFQRELPTPVRAGKLLKLPPELAFSVLVSDLLMFASVFNLYLIEFDTRGIVSN